jgi:hypothetical protein
MRSELTHKFRQRLTGAEFLVAMALILGSGLIVLSEIPGAMRARDQRVCQANLKEIGHALAMYAEESKGERYPPAKLYDCSGKVQPWTGAMDLAGVYPEYLVNLDFFVCPAYGPGRSAIEIWDEGKTTNQRWEAVEGFSNNGIVEPCEVVAKPYYYYGWALSEATFSRFLRYEKRPPDEARPLRVKDFGIPRWTEFEPETHYALFQEAVYSLDRTVRLATHDASMFAWDMTTIDGEEVHLPFGSQIVCLREGAERLYMYDLGNPAAPAAQRSKMVVLHEELHSSSVRFYHARAGMYVLYMDGHMGRLSFRSTEYPAFPLDEAGRILHAAVEGTLEAP